MKVWQLACIVSAITCAAVGQILIGKSLSVGVVRAAAEVRDHRELPLPAVEVDPITTSSIAIERKVLESPAPVLLADEPPRLDALPKQASLEEGDTAVDDQPETAAPKSELSYLVYFPYSELPPEKRPADIVLDYLKDVPVGTPIEEIKRAADAFGLDFNFMKAVAKIESDFDPKQKTGSYIGLFQLSKYEFKKYGTGEITSPRDNAVAAAYKFINEATLFELDTHKVPTFSDLYLIHQQGWQGAAEHVAHPDRIAWKSMCATDEGREKGEKWCKRAVWGNTLPSVKSVWKTVDNMTSAAFVKMWRERVDSFYARYSSAAVGDTKH